MNTAPAPRPATTSPPIAGPTAWASVSERLLSDTAAGSCGRETSSGIEAPNAGSANAAPVPMASVSASSEAGVTVSASVIAPSPAATRSWQLTATITIRRRSSTSASAPAGSASRKIGTAVAVCTSATSAADEVSEVISHEAATMCIHVPRLDATDAIQTARKMPTRSGLQGDSSGIAVCSHRSAQVGLLSPGQPA